MNKKERIEVLIHIVVWLLIFAFPLLYIDRERPDFSWMNYTRHSMVSVMFVIAFYTNYFILIPKYLFRDQVKRYIIYNMVLIAVLALSLHFWQMTTAAPPPVEARPYPRPPRIFFYLRDVFGILFSAAVCAIIRIFKRWSALESARRDAEKSRTEAELKNLRNQLNPHFLLNTLNNIYALTAFDSTKAQVAIQELSKLLRYMLYDNQQTYVTLGKEADFIRNYIELMRIRLASNVHLTTQIEIEPDDQTPVAPLLFISLIENAFKHGISTSQPSDIFIRLSESDNEIVCEIINSNFPKTDTDKSGSGIGLSQLKQRLDLLYKGNYTWEKGVVENGKMYFSRLNITLNEMP